MKRFIFVTWMVMGGMLCARPMRAQGAVSFPYPEIPVSISEPRMRLSYLLNHFWDNFLFADTSQTNRKLAEQGMADYLNRWNTVGASGAVYGILLAFGVTFPNERLFIFPIPVPIKAKYFVVGYAIIELLSALSQSSDGVAHMAHLGGMLVGLLLIIYWRRGGGNGSNGGYRSYGPRDDSWNGFRNWFSSLFKKKEPHIDVTYGGRYGQEAAYRQQKKEQEEELNRILDKVKKNGYEGLTAEEKRRLFDITRK